MPPNDAPWLMLVASLSGRTPASRMRLWRALKGAGASALRDGVYVLPTSDKAANLFRAQADEVIQAGGTAHVIPFHADTPEQDADLRAAFDRTEAYAEGLARLTTLLGEMTVLSEIETRRRLTAIRRDLESVAATDFFAGPARDQVEAALRGAEQTLNAQFSPDEPHASKGTIPPRDPADYRDRIWATRRHMWVDRVACAWLIRRFIDPGARFIWLARPSDCPPDALGFDFDGATFTHVDQRVSFEVLITSFGLDRDPGLGRLAHVVHYLDVGGVPVADAAGFASVMTGARARRREDDDGLLQDMSTMLDCLYAAYLESPGESS